MLKKFMLASLLAAISACDAYAGEAGSSQGDEEPSRLDLILGSFDRAGLAAEPARDVVAVPAPPTASDYDALIRDSFVRAGMTVEPSADNCDGPRHGARGTCEYGATLLRSE